MRRKQAYRNEPSKILGYTPTRQTNYYLKALLGLTYHLNLDDVFATNLFPFIKAGRTVDGNEYDENLSLSNSFRDGGEI